jgi:uncharacterized protein with GYD domain
MWFVTLIKGGQPPNKDNAMQVQAKMKEAEKWGVKFHQAFFTLGPYDAVQISEAPDEKTALRVALLFSDLGAESTTMAAVDMQEVMGWLMKM